MSTATPSIICKKCSGTALYDFNKGSYSCANCVKDEMEAAEVREGLAQYAEPSASPHEGPEVSLEELERRYKLADVSDEGEAISVCDCQSCGAQIEFTAQTSLASCPFCDRKVVVRQSRSTTALHAPIVVPFGIDQSLAIGKMVNHLSKLWLRPSFLRKMLISGEHVRKVYLPFWSFDAQIDTSWEAQVVRWKEPGMFGKLFGAEGKYHTDHCSGHRGQRLKDWLVCASHGLDADLIALLEPFSTSQALPEPLSKNLEDVPLERGTLGPASAWQKAKLEIRRRQYRVSLLAAQKQSKINDDEGVAIEGKVDFGEPLGKAVILPLYIFSTRTLYGSVKVVVNGETGQVASQIPYSWLKVAPLGAAGTAAVVMITVGSMGGFAPVLFACAGWGWYKRKKQREFNEATFVSS